MVCRARRLRWVLVELALRTSGPLLLILWWDKEEGLHCYPDLNNYEHASQWGQDWNAGDADTSGSSDVELHGLQKGEGAKGNGGSFNVTCYNCGKSGHSAMQRVEKQKEKDRERRETTKVGMTAKVGQSERDGQTVKVGTLQAKVGSNKGQQE